MPKKCPHQNIIITYKSRYLIKEGWTKLIEKDDVDLGKYFIEETEEGIFCEDCGNYLTD